jgi:DNA invertase Pin-like site-specific DNA recombinase
MMSDHANTKITASHLSRLAVVYLRQSTPTQVEINRESTRRQYDLALRAQELGWPADRVQIIDSDLGVSGSGIANRTGFAQLIADVALGHVGLVLGLEVSRLARNNTDWHRLIELAGLTNTLIGDADGIYHPALFNDRLLLGLKGTMSEAELYIIRARLDGGRRSKAARGEMSQNPPVGYVRGEADGEIFIHPDESVVHAIRTVFARFAELGSARQVWRAICDEGRQFPRNRSGGKGDILWKEPEYSAIYAVLSSPVYAGAYSYGRTRQEMILDENGGRRKWTRHLPRQEWQIVVQDHHEGYINWQTFEANRRRMEDNLYPKLRAKLTDKPGAAREGRALLQGLFLCGHCGRRLRVRYNGRAGTIQYHCIGSATMLAPEAPCLSVGGGQFDTAVSQMFLAALEPARLASALAAAEQLEKDHENTLRQWRLDVERAEFTVGRAERRYQAVDPQNRLVARSLEREWEESLQVLEKARVDLTRREKDRPRLLTPHERNRLLALGPDLATVWHAPTTTTRDKKELLRTLIEDITLSVNREIKQATMIVRWKGGELSHLQIELPRIQAPRLKTDEATIDLVRRLARQYSDATIASILVQQGRLTARKQRFNALRVKGLRQRQKIPSHPNGTAKEPQSEALSLREAADALGVAPTTLLRHLQDGLIEGEHLTAKAPWRIHLTPDIKERFHAEPPDGYIDMYLATHRLGLDRKALVQKIKAGEIDTAFVTGGTRKGIYIKAMKASDGLFEPQGILGAAV